MTDETYNGWKNRETWAADVHLSNDQGLYNLVSDWAKAAYVTADYEEMVDNGAITREAMAKHLLADRLKDQFEEWAQDIIDGATERGLNHVSPEVAMMLDEVGSRWRVDWEAVAQGYINTILEEEA